MLSFATKGVFQALPVKLSAGPNSPFGKMALNSEPSLFDLFSIQPIVSNAIEAIAVINNAFIVLNLLR